MVQSTEEETSEGGRRGRRRESPYQAWQKTEGIPVYKGSYIDSLYEIPVSDWERIGQKGAFVNLADQEFDDVWVMEIAAAGSTKIMHHLFEATYFVVSGRGATVFWQEEGQKNSVEWQRGSIFAPPLNCHYQIFNGLGDQPVRLMAVTNAPMLINTFRSSEFLFRVDESFVDRYGGEEDYFSATGTKTGNRWKLNFVPDIRAFGLDANANRGAGGQLTQFDIANNSMAVHTSQFPSGTYKKGHRHGVGAHLVILEGTGYSMLWLEGEEPQKVDWKEGALISPREWEYHQHFNTGPTAARYLAVRLGDLDLRHWKGFTPDQIEYEDEARSVYELYEAECAKQGATVVIPRPYYTVK
jgi:mannose-6-phosphate isomerase-like protein (cupin superfamily)